MRSRMRREAHGSTSADIRRAPAPAPDTPTGTVVRISLALAAVISVTILWSTTTGSLALWNDAETLPETSVTVGKAGPGLAIALGKKPAPEDQKTVAIDPDLWSMMLPAETSGEEITVTNYGSHPQELSVSLTRTDSTFDDYVIFRIDSGKCVQGIGRGDVLTDTPRPLGSDAIEAGDSETFCLQTLLSSKTPNEAQGTTLIPAFTMTINGIEVLP